MLRFPLFVRRISHVATGSGRRRHVTAHPPAVLFPWRSSPIALQRMVEGNDLSGQNQVFFERWIRAAAVGRALNIDWACIFQNSWKQELAEDLGWAFQKGLAGLLSQTLSACLQIASVPVNKIDFDEHGIELDTSSLSRDEQDWTDEDLKVARNYCKATFDDSLRLQYTSIDLDKFDVKLLLQPTSCRLEFAYSLPFTRELVAKDPSLKIAYRAIQDDNASLSQIDQLEKELITKSQSGTIFVDVSIECLERFQVHDKTTGKLVQGSEEGKSVSHLIRFEKQSNEASWKIVDWDDLLEGNVWH